MPIYQTAHYQINASAVDKVTTAIAEFVEYVAKNEAGHQDVHRVAAERRPHQIHPSLRVRR